jgi:transposase
MGRISRCGDGRLRALLFEAATTLICRVKRFSTLRSSGGAARRSDRCSAAIWVSCARQSG